MKYTIEHTNPMSYEEFGRVMDVLLGKIQASGVTFDAVAPILRNGAVPGTIIANKLEIVTILPVQVKYDYQENKPKQLLPFVLPLDNSLGDRPNILLVESNTYSGSSAMLSRDVIKEKIPDAILHYATVTRVYRKPQIDLPMFENYFWGVMTNEAFEATEQEIEELDLRPKIIIYPWETAQAELDDINANSVNDANDDAKNINVGIGDSE